MTIALDPITASTSSTINYIVPSDVGALFGFTAYNASPFDLTVNYGQGTRWLPVGMIDWFAFRAGIPGQVQMSVGQNPNLTSINTSTVLLTLYTAADGPPPGNYPAYIGRMLDVGGSITTTQIYPQVVGSVQLTSITDTVAHTIVTYQAGATSETLRLSASMILAGGAQNVTFQVRYTDPAPSVITKSLTFLSNAGVESLANGATAFATGDWSGNNSLTFDVQTVSTVSVTFQTTGIPTDAVTAILERLK